MTEAIRKTKREIEVMQAYVEGLPIERSYRGGQWEPLNIPPRIGISWDWVNYEFRIAERQKPRVKPLVWGSGQYGELRAFTPFSCYVIEKIDELRLDGPHIFRR